MESTGAAQHQAISFMIRATQTCSQKCDSLKLKGEIGNKEKDCLRTCAVNQAIATRIHSEFVNRLAQEPML